MYQELDRKEILGKSFVEGRDHWTKLISKFVDKHKDKCDLDILFTHKKVIPSESASDSSILDSVFSSVKNDDSKCILLSDINILGKEKDPDNVSLYKYLIGEECIDDTYKNSCVVKVSYIIKIDDDFNNIINNLDVESQIYKYAVPEIIKYTPFIINSYGYYNCNLIEYKKLNEVMKGAKDYDGDNNLSDIQQGNSEVMKLLLLEKSSGNTFHKFLSSGDYSQETLNIVLFQLFWTIHVMNRLNVKHNDLHHSNIFVDVLKEEITLYFKINDDKYVKMTTKYLLRIYDFDTSYSIGYQEIDRNLGDSNTIQQYINMVYGEIKDEKLYKMFVKNFDFFIVCQNFPYNNNLVTLINNYKESSGNIEESVDDILKDKLKDVINIIDKLNLINKNKDINTSVLKKLLSITTNIEVVSSIKEGVICFELPNKKKIEYTNPKTTESKLYSYKPVEKRFEEIKKMNLNETYIDKCIDNFVNGFHNHTIEYSYLLGYDKLKANARNLFYLYINKRNPDFLYSKQISNDILMACVLLSSPIYHKIMNNHSIYKEQIKDAFYRKFPSPNLTRSIISDIWNTFDNTLPIILPVM